MTARRDLPDDRNPDDVRRRVSITASASGWKARDAAHHLIGALADSGRFADLSKQLADLDAVSDLLEEMHRWKDSWANEHVDKDRQVRAAMARSADCKAHGEQIKELSGQLDAIDQSRDRSETCRLIMLGWYQACVTFVDHARANQRAGRALPPSDKILEWMEKQLPKVHAAHQRVFTRPTRTERTTADNEHDEG